MLLVSSTNDGIYKYDEIEGSTVHGQHSTAVAVGLRRQWKLLPIVLDVSMRFLRQVT